MCIMLLLQWQCLKHFMQKDTQRKEMLRPYILLTPTECVEKVYKNCLCIAPSDISSTAEEQPSSKQPSAEDSKSFLTRTQVTQTSQRVTSSQQTDKTPSKLCQSTTYFIISPSSKGTTKQPEKPTMVSQTTQTDESVFAPVKKDESVEARPEIQTQTMEGKGECPAKPCQEKVEPSKSKSPQPASSEAVNEFTTPVTYPPAPLHSTPINPGIHTFPPMAYRTNDSTKMSDPQNRKVTDSVLDIGKFLKSLFEASKGEPILITTTKSDKLIKSIVDTLTEPHEISFPRRKLSSSSDRLRNLTREQHFMPSTEPSLQRQYACPHQHHHLKHRRHSQLQVCSDPCDSYHCDTPSTCVVSNFNGDCHHQAHYHEVIRGEFLHCK